MEASKKENLPSQENPRWCAFQLDKGKLSKRCFFRGVSDGKPMYLFGQQNAGDKRGHFGVAKTLEGSSQSPNSQLIVQDFSKVSPQKYENTFEKLFRGTMELNALNEVLPNHEKIFDKDDKPRTQHPAKLKENASTKMRIMQNFEEPEESNVSKEEKPKKCITRREKYYNQIRHESPYWRTTFRCQNVEPGVLIDDTRKAFHKLKRQVQDKIEKKPYNTHSNTELSTDIPAETLELLKKRAHEIGAGWTIVGPNSELYNDPKCDDSLGVVSKILKKIEVEKDEKKETGRTKMIHEQGLKRSECTWYRDLKSIVI